MRAKAQYDFRHLHIVYCLLRGRTRDQIEKPTRNCDWDKRAHCYCCNRPDEKQIAKLMAEWNARLTEERIQVEAPHVA